MNCLVFDIETVPDVAFGRRLYNLDGLADEQVAKAMFALRRQDTGNDFLPFEQQRVVAISCVLRSRDDLRVWSLGDVNSSEAELVERFFAGIERFSPDLVSWNGSGFDLPVLGLRALQAGVQAPR
jgi:3'-5' exonuclease